MPLPDPGDLAKVIRKRFQCLDAIVTQPRAKPALVESLGIPRSTLDDIVRDLKEDALVQYDDGLWQPTHSGRVAHEIHRHYLDKLGSLADASPVLERVPADDAISPAFIDGATIHEPQPHVLGTELSPLLDYIDAATEIRIATPRIGAGFARRLDENGTSDEDPVVEMIAPAEVQKWFVADRLTTGRVEQPHISFLRAPVPFSFGLSVFDRQYAAITAFCERGVAGCMVNDSKRAIHWAEDQYERVKADAKPVSLRHLRRDIDLN